MFVYHAFVNSYFFRRNKERLHLYNYKRKKFAGFKKASFNGNEILKRLLSSGEPFFVGRLGGSEMKAIKEGWLVQHHLIKQENKEIMDYLKIGPGVYPNTHDFLKVFTNIYLSSLDNADYMSYTYIPPYEEYAIKKYCKNIKGVFDVGQISPVLNDWTSCLKNKKVLVVSPFCETIVEQYQKKELIFPKNHELLPDFILLTYKPVVSLGLEIPPFPTWKEALHKMEKDISKLDFDVALLSCGAYGLPLGSYIKTLNKQAIQVCGPLPLLFGIRGKIWDERHLLDNYYNDYWVYPSDKEVPKGASLVENGCYWK